MMSKKKKKKTKKKKKKKKKKKEKKKEKEKEKKKKKLNFDLAVVCYNCVDFALQNCSFPVNSGNLSHQGMVSRMMYISVSKAF